MTRERFLDTWKPSRTSNLLSKPRLSSLLSVDDSGRELFRTAPGIDIGNRAERLVRGDENRRARERRRSVAAGGQGGRGEVDASLLAGPRGQGAGVARGSAERTGAGAASGGAE